MKKILVVNVNWLGDVIMTLPIFRSLKKIYPESYIGVMVPPRCVGLFENDPYVDEIIPFDEKTTHKGILKKIAFIINLRKKHFDSVYLIHRSYTRALICLLSGIKERVGYATQKTELLLTYKINPPQEGIHRQK